MCMGGSPKVPKTAPAQEPLKNVDAAMSGAASDAARQQAMRRSLASVWTRYQTPDPNAAVAVNGTASKLGG